MTNKKKPPNLSAQSGEVRRLVRNGGRSCSCCALCMNHGAAKYVASFAHRLNIKRLGVIAMVINLRRLSAISATKLRRTLYLSMAYCSCNRRVSSLLSYNRKFAILFAWKTAHWSATFANTQNINRISTINTVRNSVNYFSFEVSNPLRNHLFDHCRRLAVGLELPARQNFNLILTTFWWVLAPRMNCLASFQVKRPLESNLGAKMIDSVLCFHGLKV